MSKKSSIPSGLKVLVADDEPGVRDLLTEHLEGLGLEVDTAVNGVKALEKIRENEYDFLITDLEMPEMNGIDLIKKVRRIRPLLPTCICSAKVNSFATQILEIAVSTSLPKPHSVEDLEECIATLVTRADDFTTLVPKTNITKLEDIMVTDVKTFTPEIPLKEVVKVLGLNNIGSALIMDNDQLLGIFTERDLLKTIAKNPETSFSAPIKDYMTKNVATAPPDTLLEQALLTMKEGNFRHLPIEEKKKILGIVSIKDITAYKIKNLQDALTDQTEKLKRFLAGIEE